MSWFVLFLIARLAVGAFVLLTWAYSVTTYSPFAFDMFVRPQLFPWLASFVVWHHLWYWGAYLLAVISLLPDCIGAGAHDRRRLPARLMALAFVVCFGAIGAYLAGTPYLPSLTGKPQGFAVALVPLIPLLWLAAIDHLATRSNGLPDHTPPISQGRLLFASLGSASTIWLVYLVRALVRDSHLTSALAWAVTAVWALILSMTAFTIVYVTLSLVTALSAARRHPRAWEHGLAVVVLAAGVCEFFRRMVFVSLSFDTRDALAISVGVGTALAAMWSGLRVRRAVVDQPRALLGIELLIAPRPRSLVGGVVVLVAVVLAAFYSLSSVEQLDWDFLIQKTIVLGEGTLIFGLFLTFTTAMADRPWSARWLLAPPLIGLALLHGMPVAARAMMATTATEQLDPEVMLDRYTSVDPAFRVTAGALIERPGPDADYNRALLQSSKASLKPLDSMPGVEFASPLVPSRKPLPHIFIFLIDGLRRDYLSPYNAAVRFTPRIDEWAGDSFVFNNAFTRYGGTWLAMPSIWSGGEVTRGWGSSPFDRINSIERLVTTNDYQFVINDHTVADHLSPNTKRTFLDPEVKSIDTDVCHLVAGLEQYMTASAGDARPVFAFLAPMNVHMLNNPRSSNVNEPGSIFDTFYEPYASRVQRVDGCFGTFIAYLKRAGQYDNSVILLTADHGESLGEGGNWGHQFWLFPEDLRIPLIVHLPLPMQTQVSTDLGRIAFSTDIAPTLYGLLGYAVRDPGPLFGSPLFVPPEEEPRPRRRDSFLVMSSYGASYGLLRRNGKFLYISDLINFREYGFELFQQPLGTRVIVSDDIRRTNQRLIRERVARFDRFYHPSADRE